MSTKTLIKLFIQACGIASPTDHEGQMAAWIEKFMSGCGWRTWKDRVGNLYAYLEKKVN